jgi:hypothetical protein
MSRNSYWQAACFSWQSLTLDTTVRTQELEPAVQMVEANGTFREMTPFLEASGIVLPVAQISGVEAWSTLMLWAEDLTSRLASGDQSVFR